MQSNLLCQAYYLMTNNEERLLLQFLYSLWSPSSCASTSSDFIYPGSV